MHPTYYNLHSSLFLSVAIGEQSKYRGCLMGYYGISETAILHRLKQNVTWLVIRCVSQGFPLSLRIKCVWPRLWRSSCVEQWGASYGGRNGLSVKYNKFKKSNTTLFVSVDNIAPDVRYIRGQVQFRLGLSFGVASAEACISPGAGWSFSLRFRQPAN